MSLLLPPPPLLLTYQYNTLVSYPAHVRILVRNGLVNKVKFLGLITQMW